MKTEHSVTTHLRLDTAEYDRIIRTYIPHYDESRQVQLDLLQGAQIPASAQILDLGAGTGSLAHAILARFPGASLILRDVDPEMLAIAQGRLAAFSNRVKVDRASFGDPLPPVDAVVSAFALHHIPNLEEKAEVYRRIRAAIRSPGIFLNADAVSGPFWPLLRDQWAKFMAGNGFTLEQGYRNLDDWAAEDTYFSAREELRSMEQAGFDSPECFWRIGPTAVIGARV